MRAKNRDNEKKKVNKAIIAKRNKKQRYWKNNIGKEKKEKKKKRWKQREETEDILKMKRTGKAIKKMQEANNMTYH